jgi:hypothetical protein
MDIYNIYMEITIWGYTFSRFMWTVMATQMKSTRMMRYATNRKVAGSSPDEANDFYQFT